jgi:hypothetical protein
MPRKTTLTQLEEREATALARLEAERKTLRAIQAKRAAEAKRLQQRRWTAAGEVVEQLGLPMDVDELRQLLLQYVPTAEDNDHVSQTV